MVNILNIISPFLAFMAAIIATIVAYKAYKISHRSREDDWIKIYREVYQNFWYNKDCEKVRTWIHCDQEYGKIKGAFTNYMRGRAYSNKEDCEVIDTFDKFISCIDITNFLHPLKKIQLSRLRQDFIFRSWPKAIVYNERIEMLSYIKKRWNKTFYPAMVKMFEKKPERLNTLLIKIEQSYGPENL